MEKTGLLFGKRHANRARTTLRLLDAAEALFAENGYHGTGLRDITDLADARLASVTEIFGSKEVLFREVFMRRSSLINADRATLLACFKLSMDKRQDIRALVIVFMKPLLERSNESEGWRNYLRLAAQVSTMRMTVLHLVADQFNPMALMFIEQMREIFPESSNSRLYAAYNFMVSTSMTIFSDNRRLNSLSNGQLRSENFNESYDIAVSFLTHGVYGMCQSVVSSDLHL